MTRTSIRYRRCSASCLFTSVQWPYSEATGQRKRDGTRSPFNIWGSRVRFFFPFLPRRASVVTVYRKRFSRFCRHEKIRCRDPFNPFFLVTLPSGFDLNHLRDDLSASNFFRPSILWSIKLNANFLIRDINWKLSVVKLKLKKACIWTYFYHNYRDRYIIYHNCKIVI